MNAERLSFIVQRNLSGWRANNSTWGELIGYNADMAQLSDQHDMKNISFTSAEIARFCEQYQIRRLALFGSVLRDDFGPASDVDVLVEFKPQAQVGLMAFARMQRELSELLQRPIDLVTPDGLKPLIKRSVLDSAKVIYAA